MNSHYAALKARLDQLHYSQPLGEESVALVEKLLADLLNTTEGFQKLKTQMAQVEKQLDADQIALIPLKKENERVVKENNQLHMEIIESKEKLESVEKSWRATTRKLEDEIDDLRLVSQQKEFKIDSINKENLKLKERLASTMEKAYWPMSNEILKTLPREIPETDENEFANPEDIELMCFLPPEIIEHEEQNRPQSDRQAIVEAELVAADHRVESMIAEQQQMKQATESMKEKISELESQKHARDEEINRLTNLYMGGETVDKMNLNYVSKENSKTVTKLENQLNYVNKENHKLIEEITDLRIRSSNAQGFFDEHGKLFEEIKSLKGQIVSEQMKMADAQRLIAIYEQKDSENKEKIARMVDISEFKKAQDLLVREATAVDQLSRDNEDKERKLMEMTNLRAAYNSDSKHLNDRVKHLENSVSAKEMENTQLRLSSVELQTQSKAQIYELNVLKGKVCALTKQIETLSQSNEETQSKLNHVQETNQAAVQELTLKEEQIRILNKHMAVPKEQQNPNTSGGLQWKRADDRTRSLQFS